MGIARFKEAVSDLTETLRRLFQDVPTRTLEPGFVAPIQGCMPKLEGRTHCPDLSPEARAGRIGLTFASPLGFERVGFNAAVRREDAWSRWASGATVLKMSTFATGSAQRMEIPPIPKKAASRLVELPPFRCRALGARSPLDRPRVRCESPGFRVLKVFQDLEGMFRLPLAVSGEDLQRLPKPLWMRYTLQLVKATQQNIRNLDVLGLYRVPVRGIRALRHDARSGRLLLELGPEAAGVPKIPLLLARNKEDRTLLTCFLEEG